MTLAFVEATGGPVPKNEAELNLQGSSGLQDGDRIQSVIFLAERLSTGSMAAGTVSPVLGSVDEADAYAGEGSPLACLARHYMTIRNNKVKRPKGLVRLAAVDELGAGTKAVQTLTFATNASGTGVWVFRIGRHRINVVVADGDTPTVQALAFCTAFTAAKMERKVPLTCAPVAGVVTLTATYKGASINSLGLSTVTDAGVTTTATWSGSYMGHASGTPGAGVQTTALDTVLAAIKVVTDCGTIVTCWEDDATLEELVDFANDRADATNKIPTYIYAANNAQTAANVAAAVTAQAAWSVALDSDDAHRVTATGVWGTGEWNGITAASAAALRAAEPHLARSLDGLRDHDAPVPASGNGYTEAHLRTLLESGFSPWYVHDGQTEIGLCRHVMCRSEWGVSDFHRIQVADLVRDRVGAKLDALDRPSIVADDAVMPSAGHVTKPKYIKATIRAELEAMEKDAYITNVDTLMEMMVQELADGELRQAVPSEAVDQLHNIMTRHDVAW